MHDSLFSRHEERLAGALDALKSRGHWDAFPEVPSRKIYGEDAASEGETAFKARLDRPFEIDQPGTLGRVGNEISPYGFPLGIGYPRAEPSELIRAAETAMSRWSEAPLAERAGVCLEVLERLNERSFELAFATMHTTGQGYVMAFQSGGPHAQDRGLEALAYAYQEVAAIPESSLWIKRFGKGEVIRLRKRYRTMPRGVGLVIACSTFPTWNAYPGLFADLMTGNAAIVKPHPGAVLPLAVTVEVARGVLVEAGFDPNLVTLAADSEDEPLAKELASRPEVRIVDYTGGSEFGEWLERNARQAALFTEKSGVNSIVIDSVDDLRATAENIAFSLSLYSGQMCTTSQNVFIPRSGIDTRDGRAGYDDVTSAIVDAVDRLLSDPARAADVLGCIKSEATLARLASAKGEGVRVLRETRRVANSEFPEARVRSPLILEVEPSNEGAYMREMFGPVSYVIPTRDTDHGLALAARAARAKGAITGAVYSTDDAVVERAEKILAGAGVPVSFNLTGPIWVNQAAAFSDYHVSGANPAGSATLCDAAFVAPRFRIVQSRIPADG
ncbi:MAG: phenylacetic acid degradation protein PaaN [Acidobacteriota bacterium]|nr:phenylacetic acid degradation protein PaaN [Acidobacteriota bacterium]